MKMNLVSYGGDSRFNALRKTFYQETSSLEIFENIFIYSESDLGKDLTDTKAFEQKKGGGLWTWKPYVIQLALDSIDMGDILLYVDLGCTLKRGKKWQKIYEKIGNLDMICFLIPGLIKNWTRKTVLNYFGLEVNTHGDLNMFTAGVMVFRKTDVTIRLIEKWKLICMSRQYLVFDELYDNGFNELKSFKEHRYDQSIINCLVYSNLRCLNVEFQWNFFENKSLIPRIIQMSRRWKANKQGPVEYLKPILRLIYWRLYLNRKFKRILTTIE